ncbi:MAG TPA: hypothetical protein VD994_16110, partial [Prosthecobacter sp.]|nr:hypothetical protein [Prosthecobacter sp.]
SDLPPSSFPASEKPPVSALAVIGGILFILIWGAACALMMGMSIFGVFMANDSGAASSDKHGGFILGVLGGQILIAAAGLPAGLAFFWPRRRSLLLGLFATLLIIGALGIVLAVRGFLP